MKFKQECEKPPTVKKDNNDNNDDPPFMILNILQKFDWTAILEPDTARFVVDQVDKNKLFLDSSIAESLTMHARNVLLLDKDNEQAQNLLRQVGRCRKLFHRVLKRIITGEIYSLPPSESDAEMILSDLNLLSSYIRNCVLFALETPSYSAIDDLTFATSNETNKLVDCAQSCLQQVLFMQKIQNCQGDMNNVAILTGILNTVVELDSSSLKMRSQQPEEDRMDMILEYSKSIMKMKKQENKMLSRCANCYVTDTDHKAEEGKALLKCTSCKQIAYCSRDCQMKDWKEHKKVCQK